MSWPPMMTRAAELTLALRVLGLRPFLRLAGRSGGGVAVSTSPAAALDGTGPRAGAADAEPAKPIARVAVMRAAVTARLVMWGVLNMAGTVLRPAGVLDGP